MNSDPLTEVLIGMKCELRREESDRRGENTHGARRVLESEPVSSRHMLPMTRGDQKETQVLILYCAAPFN